MPRRASRVPPRAAAPVAPTAGLLEAVARRARHLRAFEATLVTQEWKGRQHHETRARLLFRPPGTALMRIEESNHLPAGFAVLSDGGPTVRLKLPGLFSFVKLSVSRQDPRSRSLNGFYPDEVTPMAFAEWLRTPGVRLVPGERVSVAGDRLTLVRLERLALPADMTVAEVGIADDGRLVLMRLYAGPALRFECVITRYAEREVTEAELAL